jgi:hypothetical protein
MTANQKIDKLLEEATRFAKEFKNSSLERKERLLRRAVVHTNKRLEYNNRFDQQSKLKGIHTNLDLIYRINTTPEFKDRINSTEIKSNHLNQAGKEFKNTFRNLNFEPKKFNESTKDNFNKDNFYRDSININTGRKFKTPQDLNLVPVDEKGLRERYSTSSPSFLKSYNTPSAIINHEGGKYNIDMSINRKNKYFSSNNIGNYSEFRSDQKIPLHALWTEQLPTKYIPSKFWNNQNLSSPENIINRKLNQNQPFAVTLGPNAQAQAHQREKGGYSRRALFYGDIPSVLLGKIDSKNLHIPENHESEFERLLLPQNFDKLKSKRVKTVNHIYNDRDVKDTFLNRVLLKKY